MRVPWSVIHLTAIVLTLFTAIGCARGRPSKPNQHRDGWSRIEAESADSLGPAGAVQIRGGMLCYIKANARAQYKSVDLHTDTKSIGLNVANGGGASRIQVWVGSANVGVLTVGGTGGWNALRTQSLTLSKPQSGVQDVKLVFLSGNVNVDSFVFSASTAPTAPRTPAPKPRPAYDEYGDMLKQLGITKMRSGDQARAADGSLRVRPDCRFACGRSRAALPPIPLTLPPLPCYAVTGAKPL